MGAWGRSHKWSFPPFSTGAHMSTSVPGQGGMHLTGSSCDQTQPGHVQAASKMTLSKADTSSGARKTVLLTIKCNLHHSTIRSKACVCAKSLQSCPTLCDPMNCSPPGSSVHGILQARILEWVDMPSSRGFSWHRKKPDRGFSWHRDQTQVFHIAGKFFTISASREARSEVYSLVFFSITIIVTGVLISWHWCFQGIQAEWS